MACGPMNVLGAISFLPPFRLGREQLHLPEPDPFYLWILSAWILAFGIAYFHQGWTGRMSTSVLALGAWGKLIFAWQMLSLGISRDVPFAIASALPDLACGLLFCWWLWRLR